jgi:hypothetical protein
VAEQGESGTEAGQERVKRKQRGGDRMAAGYAKAEERSGRSSPP